VYDKIYFNVTQVEKYYKIFFKPFDWLTFIDWH